MRAVKKVDMKFFNLAYLGLSLGLTGSLCGDPVTVEPVLTTTQNWTGKPLPGFRSGQTELKVVRVQLEKGARTVIHLHPLNGVGYLLKGSLTIYATDDPDGSFADPKQIHVVPRKAGDAWAEPVNVWHYAVNTGDGPAEFIAFFAGEEGVPSYVSLGTRRQSP